MRAGKNDQDDRTIPEPEDRQSPNPPKADTSTDWDEWMEKHGGRPRPLPDVADAEGKFRSEAR